MATPPTRPSTDPELIRAANLFIVAQRARTMQKYGLVFDRSDRTRERWESRWVRELTPLWPKPEYGADLDRIVEAGIEENSRVAKGPYWDKIRLVLREIFGRSRGFTARVKDGYMSLAADTAQDAGQHTLDVLGLNTTFRWTTQRDMVRDMYSVRGSKVIQNAYGTHLDDLRKIVLEATDPARPQTQTRVRREIQEKWDRLSRSQVERIARTEVASVWETMNYNTARANEVDKFDWLIAKGPSIGPPRSLPVCRRCLARAAGGPYAPGEVEPPPRHPHCRCTLAPALEEDWLPPAKTWAGGPFPDLPLVQAPVP